VFSRIFIIPLPSPPLSTGEYTPLVGKITYSRGILKCELVSEQIVDKLTILWNGE